VADSKQKDQPNAKGAEALRMKPLIRLVRDVYGGTRVMRDAGVKHLPKHPAEDDPTYQIRLKMALLFNALKRTVGGLNGMIFRKDVELTEIDPNILEHTEDIDRRGRNLTEFAKQIAEDGLIDGVVFFHVDFPAVPDGAGETLADERALKLRPHWIPVRAKDFVSARFNVDGDLTLRQFVYREWVTETSGAFLEEIVEQFRVLRPGKFFVFRYELVDGKRTDKLKLFDTGVTNMPGSDPQEIPIVVVHAKRIGPFEGEPPLLDLAYENIAHYQVRADHLNAIHVANVPIPIFIGRERDDEEGDELKVGHGFGIDLPVDGDAHYMEWTGKSIENSRTELKDIELRMAVLGLAMLQRETRAAETAEAKAMDKAAEDSALASFAGNIESGLNRGLELHARWLAADKPGTATINRDYMITALDAATIDKLIQMVGGSMLSLDTLWATLVRGEILPDTFDPELERELIEAGIELVAPKPPPDDGDGDGSGGEEGDGEGDGEGSGEGEGDGDGDGDSGDGE